MEALNSDFSKSSTLSDPPTSNTHLSIHKLHKTWKLWYHLPNDNDWSLKSYKEIDNIDCIEQSISILDIMSEDVIKYCMLFLMKEDVFPIWEDKYNRNGGCFSYKVSNKYVKETWRDLGFLLMGESISQDKEFVSSVSGISISPKKNFCIIKIWLSTCDFQNAKLISTELKYLNPVGCLFKKHVPEY